MRGINCKTDRDKFDALNSKVISYLKKTDSNLKAVIWCNPIIHPKTKELFFTVKDRILPILKGETIIKLTKDWFPSE